MTPLQRIAYLRRVFGNQPGNTAATVLSMCDDAEAAIDMSLKCEEATRESIKDLEAVDKAVKKINALFEGVQLGTV